MQQKLAAPDIGLAMMNRQVTERAQDMQEALARRGQDKTQEVHKASIARDILVAADKIPTSEWGGELLAVCAKCLTDWLRDTVTEPEPVGEHVVAA